MTGRRLDNRKASLNLSCTTLRPRSSWRAVVSLTITLQLFVKGDSTPSFSKFRTMYHKYDTDFDVQSVAERRCEVLHRYNSKERSLLGISTALDLAPGKRTDRRKSHPDPPAHEAYLDRFSP